MFIYKRRNIYLYKKYCLKYIFLFLKDQQNVTKEVDLIQIEIVICSILQSY